MSLRRAASSSLRQLAGHGWAAEASSSSVLQGASHEALVSAWLHAQVAQHRVISSAWQPSWAAQRASIHCWQGASFAAQPAVAESSDDSQEAEAPSAGSKVHTPECPWSTDSLSMAVQLPDALPCALSPVSHLCLDTATAASGCAVLTSKEVSGSSSCSKKGHSHTALPACTWSASPAAASRPTHAACMSHTPSCEGMPASSTKMSSHDLWPTSASVRHKGF